MVRSVFLSFIMLVAVALCSGCPQRGVAEVVPEQSQQSYKDFPVEINRDIDLLFVIDDSGSMAEEHQSLIANFGRFIEVLENIEGGLPNVHIGIISTDVGVGLDNSGIQNCTSVGDDGGLQADMACQVNGLYIVDEDMGDGTRYRNYSGALTDAFSCMANLGTSGCGFEQPLESIKRALDGHSTRNDGFLRENAFLGIIIVSDEDDCSVSDTGMFDTTQNDLNTPLGPMSSYRCFEFGVVCEPDEPRSPGIRDNCTPREDSQFMTPVQDYIEFLRALKPPELLIVAGIVGDATPVTIAPDPEVARFNLQPSCLSASGEAAPAIRLQHFLDAFPQRNTSTTICNENLEGALVLIAELLKEVIGNPCLEGDIDSDPDEPGVQFDCQIMDVRNPGTDNEIQTVIPQCTLADGALPCWRIEEDENQCPDTETQLALIIERGGANVLPGTFVQIRCVVQR